MPVSVTVTVLVTVILTMTVTACNDQVGRGACAVVYSAIYEDEEGRNNRVAVKVLHDR